MNKTDDGPTLQKTCTLEWLVSAAASFLAGRPHDIIYAVLSLAKDVSESSVSVLPAREPDVHNPSLQIPMRPDQDKIISLVGLTCRVFRLDKYPVGYEKPFNQACRDFLEFTTTEPKSLDMICWAWVPVLIDEGNYLPSWIRTLVDWPFGRDSVGYQERVHIRLRARILGNGVLIRVQFSRYCR